MRLFWLADKCSLKENPSFYYDVLKTCKLLSNASDDSQFQRAAAPFGSLYSGTDPVWAQQDASPEKVEVTLLTPRDVLHTSSYEMAHTHALAARLAAYG